MPGTISKAEHNYDVNFASYGSKEDFVNIVAEENSVLFTHNDENGSRLTAQITAINNEKFLA